MNSRLITITLVTSTFFAGLTPCFTAGAQIAKSGGGYKMRMKWVKGQTLGYTMNISGSGEGLPNPIKQSMPFKMKITDVKADVATIESRISVPGAAKETTVTMKMDSTGKVVSGDANTMGIQTSFPTQAVKVGDSWKREVPLAAAGMASTKLKATYTFKGTKMLAGKEVAVISVKMKGDSTQFSTDGIGTMYYTTSDGQLKTASIDMVMAMAAQPGTKPMKLKMNTSIKRTQ